MSAADLSAIDMHEMKSATVNLFVAAVRILFCCCRCWWWSSALALCHGERVSRCRSNLIDGVHCAAETIPRTSCLLLVCESDGNDDDFDVNFMRSGTRLYSKWAKQYACTRVMVCACWCHSHLGISCAYTVHQTKWLRPFHSHSNSNSEREIINYEKWQIIRCPSTSNGAGQQ